MTHRSSAALLLFASLAASAHVNAQVSSSASATTTVVDPAVIAAQADLDFGRIDAGSARKVVVVAPQETSGPAGSRDSAGGASPAVVTVAGASDQSYSVSLPRQARTLVRENGGETVKVGEFTSDLPEGMLLSGEQTIRIGATLSMEERQAPGRYVSPSGIPVIVNYN